MKCYITNIPACDGFGARFQRLLNLLFFSLYAKEKYGYEIEFMYTPLSYEGFGDYFYDLPERIEHYFFKKEDYKNRAIEWDKKLNYQGLKIDDINLSNYNVFINPTYSELIQQLENIKTDNNLFVYGDMAREFNDNTIDIKTFSKYRDCVLSMFNIKGNRLTNDKLNIAMHIRRADALPRELRWVKDEYYLDIIHIIEKNLNIPYNLTIYTQKEFFEFDKFNNYKIIYDEIDEDYDSFVDLIYSDILILGKSSFSYAAGLLNKNLVVYNDFWHSKLKDWIKATDLEFYIKNNY